MSIAQHIKATLELPSMIVRSYLEDLNEDDLFVRPLPKMNHIAWQLGHLIASENFHINHLVADSMPPLPDGFRERHSADTAMSDDRDQFHPKAEYLDLMHEQRAATLSLLAQQTDEQLQQPSPEAVNYLGTTVGSVFSGEATHWMMHAGQWAVVRRKLGKPPLF